MGRRKKITIGQCKICGVEEKLTFEHIPPRAAFNETKIKEFPAELALSNEPIDYLNQRGKLNQKGNGLYCLCGHCNSYTGAHYGKKYAEWAYQALRFVKISEGTNLIFSFRIFPLEVLKQIISNFISISHEGFTKKHPHLKKFVLDKNMRYLPAAYRVYAYLHDSPAIKMYGPTFKSKGYRGEVDQALQMEFRPFGYILTVDTDPPQGDFLDITFFSEHLQGEDRELSLPIKKIVLPRAPFSF